MRPRGLLLFAAAYFVILELLLVAAALAWPAFLENIGALRSMAAPIPVLGAAMDQIQERGFPAYLLAQHFFKGCNTLGAAAAVLFAAPAVAGEAHRGTLELWLARPLSRRRILLERWGAGALALCVPIFLTTLTIPILAERIDEWDPLGPYLECALHQSLFLLAIYAVAFLWSTLGSHPGAIALWMLFVTTFEFAIYMIKVWTHWSLFRLCDIQTLLDVIDHGLDVPLVGGLVLASAACLGASLFAFERRTP
jgi:ABC-type transport system involved in multi-copper enzyme maturation permease subunit